MASDSVREPSCGERAFREDKKFVKYVESTTTHGVSHIFIGKSKIRRVFWLIIFLAAAGGCLYNIVNRIMYLASGPTSTTVSLTRENSLLFPQVTFCNLNLVRRSYVEERNLTDFFRGLVSIDPTDPSFNQSCNENIPTDVPIDFDTVLVEGSHSPDDFILFCQYAGHRCTEDQILPVFSDLGLCYTFNSGYSGHTLRANGTGIRHGLQLTLNIQQSEYIPSPNLDAGVKIAIHPQGEPGEPDENGIAVPPGRNAFISLRQKVVTDKSGRGQCIDSKDFEFLRGVYNYSVAACLSDCFLAAIAEMCQCIPEPTESNRFVNFSDCDIGEICCVIEQFFRADACTPNCPPACNYTTFTTSISYSAFPARYQIDPETFDEVFNSDFDVSYLQENVLRINIYFGDLNVEREITVNAYDVVALLSDIGGQMGLFLGASVISIMEFVTWILDEVKDRCFGMSDRKIYGWMHSSANSKDKEKGIKLTNIQRAREPSVTELENLKIQAAT